MENQVVVAFTLEQAEYLHRLLLGQNNVDKIDEEIADQIAQSISQID